MTELCSPQELAKLMRDGDMEALDRMSRCFGDRLLAVGRRYCGDQDRALDAVQDTMVAAGASMEKFRGDGSVEGWLVRMVVNFCHRQRRGRKNDPSWHVEAVDDALAAKSDSPEDQAARGELMMLIGDALQQLEPRDRTLLLLSDAQGWKSPEIAEALEMTPAAVRTRLSRARRRLREHLEPHAPDDG